jgi:hypothetical protein
MDINAGLFIGVLGHGKVEQRIAVGAQRVKREGQDASDRLGLVSV